MREYFYYDTVNGLRRPHYGIKTAAALLVFAAGFGLYRLFSIKGLGRTASTVPFIVLVLTLLAYWFIARAYFEADGNAVYFKQWLTVRRISYSTIISIDIEYEYRVRETSKGIFRYYAEKLTFNCTNGTYVYCGIIDAEGLPMKNDPDIFNKETENGKFTRLKRYIEENCGIQTK